MEGNISPKNSSPTTSPHSSTLTEQNGNSNELHNTIPLSPAINRFIADVTGHNGQVSIIQESDIPHIILPDLRANGGPPNSVPVASEITQNHGGAGGDGPQEGSASRDSPPIVVSASGDPNEDSKRYCWVCFADDADDLSALWTKPCRCRGTTKWVHQACIQRWIDEKQKGNTAAKVLCPQCNTEYFIFYPPQGKV